QLLESENQTVEAIHTTHAELAGFLQQFIDAADANEVNAGHGALNVRPEGSVAAFNVKASKLPRGNSTSPFGDGASSNQGYEVTNLLTGQKIYFEGLVPELIGRYGYYGSKDEAVGNRTVAPQEIARMAGIVEHGYGDDDPVIDFARRFSRARMAIELSEPGNPQASIPAELSTAEQVDRFMNLASVVAQRIDDFVPSVHVGTAETAVAFLGYKDRNRLFHGTDLLEKLDCSNLTDDERAPLTVTSPNDMQVFLGRLANLDPEAQQLAVNAISEVEIKFPYENNDSTANRYTADALAKAALETNNESSKEPVGLALAKKSPNVIMNASAEFRPRLAALGLIPEDAETEAPPEPAKRRRWLPRRNKT
ncbi:MAG TPA: hypothetical protein VMR98_00205, partial [Candidatus Polarisedimenticolaceae bacterium]|nr:hypothetical protein [Candidatus Polarisedimenticolaceae bacterium]